MNRFLRTALVPAILLASLLLPAAGSAAPLQAGAPLPALALKDQHDRPLGVTRDTRIVFLAAEMSASRLMAKALEALPATALQDRQAVYIADISDMPHPISSIVALPRMRKLPYPVAVVQHAGDVAQLPRKPGAVTVLTTEGGAIRAIAFAQTPEAIGQYLK